MSDVNHITLNYTREYSSSPLPKPQWLDDFTELLSQRAIGTPSEELLKPKEDAERIVRNFASDFIPEEAISIAQVAHIAELMNHETQGPGIRRDIYDTFNSTELKLSPEKINYIEGIFTDFPGIADFARKHNEAVRGAGKEFIDVHGLVNLAENTNFESIILKAALDYSNFELLETKDISYRENGEDPLTGQEWSKMDRIITTIKTIDAPLLEITGFDALAAALLSRVYQWELTQSGNGLFVEMSRKIFDDFGGHDELKDKTEYILKELFPEDHLSHQQVTEDQNAYQIYFTDGSTKLPPYSDDDYRILARIKSVGSAARKLHRIFERQGDIKRPADIIGLTLITPDNAGLEHAIHYVMDRLPKGTKFLSAPSREEILHLKGSQEFIDEFTSPQSILADYDLTRKAEVSDNGYEAVKMAFLYEVEGHEIPVEIQFTHEESRRQLRTSPASHTFFKLTKLLGHNNILNVDLTNEELVAMLDRVAVRKKLLRSDRYEIVPASAERAEAFRNPLLTVPKALAAVAIHS